MKHHKRSLSRIWLASTFLIPMLMGVVLSAGLNDDELSKQVIIRRDTYGVPHILAESEEAAGFGQGYVAAEDHIRVIGRLVLKARSEEAAFFGEDFAASDLATKELQIYQRAERGYKTLPPWLQRILDAYAAGLNRYIAQHRAELPHWVRPVTAVDIVAHSRRVILMEFSMNLRQLRNIGRPRRRAATAEQNKFLGSNMWAIGKGRSASGNGILLGNPHLAWRGSQLFHEMQITVPGRINFSGTTLVGTPGLAIGFNENLGWSHTVNSHDSDDLYELTVDKEKTHYLYDGDWLPLKRETITIQVKTDQGLKPRSKEIYWSHYGPVLRWYGGKGYAFKSANLDEVRFLEQWYLMAKAHNLEEFRRILDMQAIPMFNICYADKEGNVFYLFNGRFPDRPAGYEWSGIVPGNTSTTEWNHLLPQSRLPQLLNPPGSYVQNCNSSPWYTNLRALIDRLKFPKYLTPNSNSLRTQHSLQLLEADESITLDEVLRYKYSMKLLLADRVKADLLRIARAHTEAGTNLEEAAGLLASWDNTVARQARGAVLFEHFWRTYREQARPIYAVPWDEKQPVTTPHGLGDEAAALQSLTAAVTEVKRRYGSLDVPWGEIHRLRRGDIDVPIGGLTGDFGAFRVIGYAEADDGKFVGRGGDSYVLAVEFTNPPKAYSVVAYSQTDDPHSPHHTDQSLLFAQEKWKRAWFTEKEIAAHLERSYHP